LPYGKWCRKADDVGYAWWCRFANIYMANITSLWQSHNIIMQSITSYRHRRYIIENTISFCYNYIEEWIIWKKINL